MRLDLRRLALWTVLFVAAGYLGRSTIIDGRSLSLVWPAAGVAALWFATAERRHRVGDVLALSTATFVVNLTTGATAQLGLVFVLANLLQASVFVLLLARLRPQLVGVPARGVHRLDSLADLGGVSLAASVSAFLAALVGWAGLAWLFGAPDIQVIVAWWVRNAVGIVVLTTLGLLLRPWRGREVLWSAMRPPTTSRLVSRGVELTALTLVTVVLMWLVFDLGRSLPLAFLLLFTTVLAGVRFCPIVVGLHGLVLGSVTIVLTLTGHGPFVAIDDLYWRALVVQLFVALATVEGLVLALNRQEREALLLKVSTSEREAAERAELLSDVLESLHEGVAVVRGDGKVLLRNEAGRSLMGLDDQPGDQVLPVEHYGLLHPDGRPLNHRDLPFVRALAGEVVRGEDLHLRTGDLGDRILEMDARKLRSHQDELDRAIVTYRDVTAERAERDNLASFAGVVAHDLISPLSAIQGWSSVLESAFEEGSVPRAEGLSYVSHITSSSERMYQFIQDLLSYTVARDTQLEPVDLDLTAIVNEVAAVLAESDTRPVFHVQPRLRVRGDRLLVQQLVNNLAGNAVKYVAPGVRPEVHVTGSALGDRLEVVFSDNGIGVPLEHRRRIFDNFQRVHVQGYTGTGLGLAICRRAVERHDGSLGVRDNPSGTGSQFVFTLPLAPPAAVAVAS